ncbi:hypothetical protein ACP4OV_028237 [Aristida adscensionis]
MVTLANLRRLYGDVVERATLARDLLAPAAGRLPAGDPAGLRRRCVLGQRLGMLRRPDDVRADLAPFGDVEAVAVCDVARNAVIVFRAEASVAVALRRQEETRIGLFSAVPPPGLALPRRFIKSDLVEVSFYPPTPSTPGATSPTSGEDTMQQTAEPRTETDREAMAELWMVESRPSFLFLNSPDEAPMAPIVSGTTQFSPSRRSLLHGPMLGADGHLWMDGVNFTYHERAMQIDDACIRYALEEDALNYLLVQSCFKADVEKQLRSLPVT